MSKFTLSKLPAEIRNKIYRLVLMTEQLVVIELTETGPQIDPGNIKSADSTPETIVDWHAMDTAILRTSRQIYHEASAILYEENHFHYAFNEPRMSKGVPFGVNMNNFKLLQKLTISFHLCIRSPSVDHACKFMETLRTLECSFKTLVFNYRFGSDQDLLFLTYFSDNQLTTSISAVDVQGEINFSFTGDSSLNATLSACVQNFVHRIAIGKSWVAKAYNDLASLDVGSDTRIRYSILPKSAQVGV